MRAVAALLLTLILGLAAPGPGRAASLVIDADSGRVLQQDEATRPWFPASLTKMMTAYLVFEALEAGGLSLSTALEVSKAAAAQPPTRLGLGAGASLTVEQALGALVVRSANDAAVVLAEALAESEAGFALLMTAKARALGMVSTRFRNASGLPDPAQVTTARDLALLARALIREFPERYALFARRSFRYGGRDHAATNGWSAGYPGADGIKTGFTCASGYNLAASAERDGRRLISIVLGARTSAVRNVTVSRLLDHGFARLALPETNGPLVEELAALDPAGDGPPTVLPPKDCVVAASPATAEAPLSGWGVIFGSFRERERANQMARLRRKELAQVIDGGRVAIVAKPRPGFVGHSALIVGLSKEDAGRACRHLWDRKAYCLSLAPQVLTNPDALWR